MPLSVRFDFSCTHFHPFHFSLYFVRRLVSHTLTLPGLSLSFAFPPLSALLLSPHVIHFVFVSFSLFVSVSPSESEKPLLDASRLAQCPLSFRGVQFQLGFGFIGVELNGRLPFPKRNASQAIPEGGKGNERAAREGARGDAFVTLPVLVIEWWSSRD